MSFLSNLEWRRAEKTFSPLTDHQQADVEKVLNAMIQAPSSFGAQPYHIVAVQDPCLKTELRKVSYNQAQVEECHTLFVICARTDISDRVQQYIRETQLPSPYAEMMTGSLSGKSEEWCARQSYIALGFGLAACAELNLGSCPMEGFSTAGVKKVLELPEHLVPYTYLAVGGKKEDAVSFPRFRFSQEDMVTRK